MKNKKTPVRKAKIHQFKGDVDVLDIEHIEVARQITQDYVDLRKRHLVSYVSWTWVVPVFISLSGAIVSSIVVSFVFSDLPQIPRGYASLISIVISSVVGISVIFLLVRIIYRRRKSESEEIFRRVRSKEKELFEMLDLDFGSIIGRRGLDAGQTN